VAARILSSYDNCGTFVFFFHYYALTNDVRLIKQRKPIKASLTYNQVSRIPLMIT